LLDRREKDLKGALRAALQQTRAVLGALVASDGFAGYAARVKQARGDVGGLARALVGSVRRLPSVYGERLARAEGRVPAWPWRAGSWRPGSRSRAPPGRRAVNPPTRAKLPKGLTFEKALSRLQEIVNELEDPEKGLESSLGLFEEGVALSRFCRGKIDEIQSR